MNAQTGYPMLESPVWNQIITEYQFYLISDDLRKELREFYGLMSQYRELTSSLFNLNSEVLTVMLREASRYWGDVANVEYRGDWTGGNTAPFWVTNALMFNEHPRETISRNYPGRIQSYTVIITKRNNPNPLQLNSSEGLAKFDLFFEETVSKIQSTKTIVSITNIVRNMRLTGNSVKDRLLIYIQEPWSA